MTQPSRPHLTLPSQYNTLINRALTKPHSTLLYLCSKYYTILIITYTLTLMYFTPSDFTLTRRHFNLLHRPIPLLYILHCISTLLNYTRTTSDSTIGILDKTSPYLRKTKQNFTDPYPLPKTPNKTLPYSTCTTHLITRQNVTALHHYFK